MNCRDCKDTGVIKSLYCRCRTGRALLESARRKDESEEKLRVPRVAEAKGKDFEGLSYFEQLGQRWALKTHGKTLEEVQEEKVQDLLKAMRAGKVTTAQVYHEKDRRKLADRFGLWDTDDFLPVVVPANKFREYYPRHEGNQKVRAYRLNPHKYGRPGPESGETTDLFTNNKNTD